MTLQKTPPSLLYTSGTHVLLSRQLRRASREATPTAGVDVRPTIPWIPPPAGTQAFFCSLRAEEAAISWTKTATCIHLRWLGRTDTFHSAGVLVLFSFDIGVTGSPPEMTTRHSVQPIKVFITAGWDYTRVFGNPSRAHCVQNTVVLEGRNHMLASCSATRGLGWEWGTGVGVRGHASNSRHFNRS